MYYLNFKAGTRAYALHLFAISVIRIQLCAVRTTLAAQDWYSPDSAIANRAIDCRYMNEERHLGRICLAHHVLFDRQQQEPGQMLNMLVRTTPVLVHAYTTDPTSAPPLHSTVVMLLVGQSLHKWPSVSAYQVRACCE